MAVKCSSGVCSGADPATTQALRQLQSVTNRYSADPDIGFTPIATDGLVGPATSAAVFYALTSVSLSQNQDVIDMQLAGASTLLIDQLNTPQDIAEQADYITQVLDTAAGVLGLPPANAIPPAPVSAPKTLPAPRGAAAAAAQKAVLDKKPGITGGLFGLGLPTWVIYVAGGGVAYFVIGFFVQRLRKSRRLR